jgi:pimeloyl-ACP methyl ester carboxylesterase
MGSQLLGVRTALVAAPCARMAIAALTASCVFPAGAAAVDLRPCAGGARCGSVTVPLAAADPAAGTTRVGFEVYRHRGSGKARDTVLVSAGNDGVPTSADRAALLALLAPLRSRRDIVLVDARGSGRSGRVGDHRDAYGAGAAAADLDAVRAELGVGHVELYAAGDGGRIGLAYAARFAGRLRALVFDGGPRATLFAGDGRAEARALAKALGPDQRVVARLARRLRVHPLHLHGRIDDDVLARLVARGDARSVAQLPAAAAAALHGDAVPLARLVAAAPPAATREAAQARASACHDDVPPAAAAAVDGGPFTGATWLRALGLAACKNWPAPPAPDPVVPTGAAMATAPALVLGGEFDVGAPTAALRKVAGLLPSGRLVRVRGAGALPALSDPAGCAATLARAFLQTRGHVSPGCASRPSPPGVVRSFPLRLAAATAALRDANAHGRDRSTLADRRAATAAALGVADALAGAGAPGAPTRVPGLRGGVALVARRGTTVTLTLRGVRFVSDAALDGIVTNDSKTGSVYAAVTLRGGDGSLRAFVLTWNTNQVKSYAAARGSVDTRALLLVLPAP